MGKYKCYTYRVIEETVIVVKAKTHIDAINKVEERLQKGQCKFKDSKVKAVIFTETKKDGVSNQAFKLSEVKL